MLFRTTKLILCIVGAAILGSDRGARAADALAKGETVIYRKALDGDREIVVVRGTPLEPAVLTGIVAPEWLKTAQLVREVRTELRSKDRPALALGSRLQRIEKADPNSVCAVLDVFFDPGKLAAPKGEDRPARIVVAMGEEADIILWELNLIGQGQTRSATLNASKWSAPSWSNPIDVEMVKVTLRLSAGGLVQAKVIDKTGIGGEGLHSTHDQLEGKWEFKVTSRTYAGRDFKGTFGGGTTQGSGAFGP